MKRPNRMSLTKNILKTIEISLNIIIIQAINMNSQETAPSTSDTIRVYTVTRTFPPTFQSAYVMFYCQPRTTHELIVRSISTALPP